MRQLPLDNVHIDELLLRTVEIGCKELHMVVGQSPRIGSCGGLSLDALSEYQDAAHIDVQQMTSPILQTSRFANWSVRGNSRFHTRSRAKPYLTPMLFIP